MRISDVLRGKSGQVVTVVPDTPVDRLLAVLAEHRIGAAVVSRDGSTVDGIVSERDVVRKAHDNVVGMAMMKAPEIVTIVADLQ